jgi:hypothetical protein
MTRDMGAQLENHEGEIHCPFRPFNPLTPKKSMKRRQLLQSGIAALTGCGLQCRASAQDVSSSGMLDRFGGWKGKRFRATGFFRVEKDKRWWLVTPDGNAFLSLGINHLYQDLFLQPFNRESWKKRLKVTQLSGSEFQSALRGWFLQTCGDYGFNTVGVHNSLQIVNTPRPSMPYVQPIQFINIPHWKQEVPDSSFLDVFASEFSQRCDQMAKEVATPARDDAFLLGYAIDGLPIVYRTGLPRTNGYLGRCTTQSSHRLAPSAAQPGG